VQNKVVEKEHDRSYFYHRTNDRATFQAGWIEGALWMNPPQEELETLAEAEPAVAEEADGRRRRGNRTRESILQAAADLASVEGLEGLTIGRLAAELGMSKSGLFAHFGSKEELQLATIDAARRRFVEHVVKPSRHLPRGRERLEMLLRDWLRYYRDQVFAGGCFFHTVKAEFDSRPTSAVRQVVTEDAREFLAFLTREVRKAQEAGDLDASVEPEQIAFELDALGAAAHQQFQLVHDPAVFDRAERAMTARLAALAIRR
jgi:AcrR family transcriptional regulator